MPTKPTGQPRFLLDRTTGTSVLRALREDGWDVLRISDVFPDDAARVTDQEWIAYGSQYGYALITADKKIRHQPSYRVATTPIFALSSNNLKLAEQVRRLLALKKRIWAEALNGRREYWVIYGERIERRDP